MTELLQELAVDLSIANLQKVVLESYAHDKEVAKKVSESIKKTIHHKIETNGKNEDVVIKEFVEEVW